MPKASSPEPEVQEMEAPKGVSLEEYQSLLNRFSILEKLAGSTEVKKEEPKNISHEMFAKLEKPKTIVFTINALEQENAMHDGAYIPGKALVSVFKFVDELKCNENGTRYTTGFEYDELEQASNLKDEEFLSYAREVRVARQWIERYFPANLDAENRDFWKSRKLRIESLNNIYKADSDNLENLIMYYNILGGGYRGVARSFEECKNSITGQILYMSVQEEEENRKFSHRGSFIKAMGKLDEIRNSWTRSDALNLMYYLPIKKYKGYTTNTPTEHILNELADFIEGADLKMGKKERPQMFLDAVDKFKNKGVAGKDLVRTTALFNAAEYYAFIQYNSREKVYRNRSTGFEYGNNKNAAIDMLMSDKNIEERSWLMAKVNEKWIS